jgi:aerobic carbon-monoxide dehydrogenase medium subunit
VLLAAGPAPRRAAAAEASLVGRPPSAENLREAAALAAAEVEAPSDREFRRALARELAERALTKAAARAKEAA